MTFELEESWQKELGDELKKSYMHELQTFIESEYASGIPIYPPKNLIFNAFLHTPFDKVKVVIVGQDPYHGPGQAHGLCFSVPHGTPFPPTLKNIFKELQNDLGIPAPQHGCLISWADQGVLLLNATLTVQEKDPLSHHGKGWEQFTDAVITKLCEKKESLIFVLWGKNAQKKFDHICQQKKNHICLTAPHPSPLSAYQGFFGCRHFSKINEILIQQGKKPIDWVISPTEEK